MGAYISENFGSVVKGFVPNTVDTLSAQQPIDAATAILAYSSIQWEINEDVRQIVGTHGPGLLSQASMYNGTGQNFQSDLFQNIDGWPASSVAGTVPGSSGPPSQLIPWDDRSCRVFPYFAIADQASPGGNPWVTIRPVHIAVDYTVLPQTSNYHYIVAAITLGAAPDPLELYNTVNLGGNVLAWGYAGDANTATQAWLGEFDLIPDVAVSLETIPATPGVVRPNATLGTQLPVIVQAWLWVGWCMYGQGGTTFSINQISAMEYRS